MTNKEIEIQIALGTLPLWRRIELGEVKLIETRLKFVTVDPGSSGPSIATSTIQLMKISCEDVTATYTPTNPAGRQYAIQRLINKAKILKL